MIFDIKEKMDNFDPYNVQVHLNKLECRGKVHYFSNSTQIVKLVY